MTPSKGNQILYSLTSLAAIRLTQKQRAILLALEKNHDLNITLLIKQLAKELSCTEGCLWINARQLSSSNIITAGRGKPATLNPAGNLIVNQFKKRRWLK